MQQARLPVDFDPVESPAFRLLFFLTVAGVFFYRSYPRPEWKWYLGLPVYWAYVLFFYRFFAAIMSAGIAELFKDRISPSELEPQTTITALILLGCYRLFSRYIPADESTEWAAGFIKDILGSFLAISALVFAFFPYLENPPRLEAFSNSWPAYVTLAICVSVDIALWRTARRRSPRSTIDA